MSLTPPPCQVCDSTPHCKTVEEEKCSTKYQKICDPGLLEGADLKVVEEQRGEAKKIFSPVFEPSPEKGRKRREVEPEAEVEQGGRRKRHALIKKLFDFIGDKKKKEELCHHVPHKHCVKVALSPLASAHWCLGACGGVPRSGAVLAGAPRELPPGRARADQQSNQPPGAARAVLARALGAVLGRAEGCVSPGAQGGVQAGAQPAVPPGEPPPSIS